MLRNLVFGLLFSSLSLAQNITGPTKLVGVQGSGQAFGTGPYFTAIGMFENGGTQYLVARQNYGISFINLSNNQVSNINMESVLPKPGDGLYTTNGVAASADGQRVLVGWFTPPSGSVVLRSTNNSQPASWSGELGSVLTGTGTIDTVGGRWIAFTGDKLYDLSDQYIGPVGSSAPITNNVGSSFASFPGLWSYTNPVLLNHYLIYCTINKTVAVVDGRNPGASPGNLADGFVLSGVTRGKLAANQYARGVAAARQNGQTYITIVGSDDIQGANGNLTLVAFDGTVINTVANAPLISVSGQTSGVVTMAPSVDGKDVLIFHWSLTNAGYALNTFSLNAWKNGTVTDLTPTAVFPRVDGLSLIMQGISNTTSTGIDTYVAAQAGVFKFTYGGGSPGPGPGPGPSPITVTSSVNPVTAQVNSLFTWSCSASGGTPPYNYIWNFSNGTSVPSAQTTKTYSNSGTYSGMCTVTDATNKTSTGSQVTVTVTDPPPPTSIMIKIATDSGGLVPQDGVYDVLGGTQLTFSVLPNASYCNWNFGNGSSTIAYPAQFTYTVTTPKLYTVTASCNNGSASTKVNVTPNGPPPQPPDGTCDPSIAANLCLFNKRFTVTLTAVDGRTGKTGTGQALPENDLFGYFSIPALTFNPDNPEVFIKILDGTLVNGKYWVFYNGLTDLEYTLTVTDTKINSTKIYKKAFGSTCGGFDTNAF